MKTKLDPLDNLFSEYIRKRAIIRTGGCEKCLTPKYDTQKEDGTPFPAWRKLQCAHLISRWHKSTRWDEDVALGLCGACHIWIDHEAEEKIALLKQVLGQDGYNLLLARSRPGKPDKKAIELYLKEKIKTLGY